MRRKSPAAGGRVAALACVLALGAAVPGVAAAQWVELDVPPRPAGGEGFVEAGRDIYDTHCWYCHGEAGDGMGPVAEHLWPRPRDFQLASFKLRTTPSGELPTDEDLFRTITLGAPGTAMPAWDGILTPRQRWQVIDYLKTFGDGIFEDEAFDPYERVLEIGSPPAGGREALVEAGRRLYRTSDCWECHGTAGRGDGPKADQLTDDRGLPIRATDLELAWKFRGGRTPRDAYVRLSTGLDGTPMPSYAQTLTDEERWQLGYFVASLAEEPTAEGAGLAIVPASRVDGGLPEAPDDVAWEDATAVWLPLTGQATYAPRWQVPSVTDLLVQAVYDESGLALRVRWNDPFADTATAPVPGGGRAGWRAEKGFPVLFPDGATRHEPYGDELEVLHPDSESGPALPHFVYGDSRRPVRLWRWTAEAPGGSGLRELRAAGAEDPPAPVSVDRQLASARATWADGRWTVVLRRPFAADAPFRPGGLVPIAFHVRDGSQGEVGLRMSVSSWYFLQLREPTGARDVLLVLLAVAGVAIVELLAVRAARRAAREGRLRRFGVGGGGDRG